LFIKDWIILLCIAPLVLSVNRSLMPFYEVSKRRNLITVFLNNFRSTAEIGEATKKPKTKIQ